MIIAAAQDSIVEFGFPTTSARVIAARCEISLGTLTYHFESIDALLLEALREASERMTEEIRETAFREQGAVNRLRRIVDHALPNTVLAKRNWRLWLECWARASHVPGLAQLHSERYEAWRGLIQASLREGVASGELKDVNVEQTTMRIVALVDGLGLQVAIGDAGTAMADAREILYSTVDELATT